MDAFLDSGGNFLDTADYYSRWLPGHTGGESEEIIGHWMKARRTRSQIILATKARHPMGPRPNDQGLSRKHLLEAVDASNYPAWRLIEALWSADVHHTVRFDLLEPHYNLVHREEFERDLKTICEQYQIGVTPYSSLANGFLTGKYTRNKTSESARAGSVLKRYNNDAAWQTLEAVQDIAREIGSTPTAVSLAWLLAQPVITAPIIGANAVAQLQQSLTAINITLTSTQLTQLEEVSAWQEA
jgi:aryl-alcohol dehydrogenase-like predicted oxidoreductase